MSILTTEQGKTITLADGNEYELPVLNLNTLANLEKSLGYGLNKLTDKVDEMPATTLRDVIFALLREKDSKIKIEQVGELITLEVMGGVSDVLSQLFAASNL